MKSVQRELAVQFHSVPFRSVPMEIYSAAAGRVGFHRHLLMVEQPCKNGGYLFFRKASANPLSFAFKVRALECTLCLKKILGLIRLRWHSASLFVCLFKLNTGMVILKKQFTLFWDQEKERLLSL